MTRTIGIGWDVGGWMGKANAFAAAEVSSDGGVLWIGNPFCRRVPREGGFLLPDLMSALGLGEHTLDDADARIVVAVDAPLGFPSALRALVCGDRVAPHGPPRYIDSPLGFRETERHVHRTFGWLPLSAPFDKLGNNATVAITHVGDWRHRHGFSVLPFDGDRHARRQIIEVYPALVKQRRSQRVVDPFSQYLGGAIEGDPHQRDARICALLALAFAADGSGTALPRLKHPPKDSGDVFQEGWIYYPENR